MNQQSFEIGGRLFSLTEILVGIGAVAAVVLARTDEPG